MVIVGIDPGKKGAIAILDNDNYCVMDTPVLKLGTKNTYDVPEMRNIIETIEYRNNCKVFIENVHAMPGQGVTSMFDMGYGVGLWIGIVSTLHLSLTQVTPQAWKKAMMNGMPKEKESSVYRAQQLFPNARLTGPRGAKLDGRADALLIAEYGRKFLA